jgi:hypothetical protein
MDELCTEANLPTRTRQLPVGESPDIVAKKRILNEYERRDGKFGCFDQTSEVCETSEVSSEPVERCFFIREDLEHSIQFGDREHFDDLRNEVAHRHLALQRRELLVQVDELS